MSGPMKKQDGSPFRLGDFMPYGDNAEAQADVDFDDPEQVGAAIGKFMAVLQKPKKPSGE